jgi:hypothetical protein
MCWCVGVLMFTPGGPSDCGDQRLVRFLLAIRLGRLHTPDSGVVGGCRGSSVICVTAMLLRDLMSSHSFNRPRYFGP